MPKKASIYYQHSSAANTEFNTLSFYFDMSRMSLFYWSKWYFTEEEEKTTRYWKRRIHNDEMNPGYVLLQSTFRHYIPDNNNKKTVPSSPHHILCSQALVRRFRELTSISLKKLHLIDFTIKEREKS